MARFAAVTTLPSKRQHCRRPLILTFRRKKTCMEQTCRVLRFRGPVASKTHPGYLRETFVNAGEHTGRGETHAFRDRIVILPGTRRSVRPFGRKAHTARGPDSPQSSPVRSPVESGSGRGLGEAHGAAVDGRGVERRPHPQRPHQRRTAGAPVTAPETPGLCPRGVAVGWGTTPERPPRRTTTVCPRGWGVTGRSAAKAHDVVAGGTMGPRGEPRFGH